MIEAIGTGLLIVAMWLLGKSGLGVYHGLACRHWPVANGKLITVDSHVKANSEGDEVRRYTVVYSFSVDGTVHTGNCIRFGVPSALLWFNPSDSAAREWRRGGRVAVYYNPSRPSLCVLQQGVSPFAFLMVAVGIAIGWLGLAALGWTPG